MLSAGNMKRAVIHLLAGGPGSNVSHMVFLLREALGFASVKSPSVAYIGAASADDAGFFKRISGLLQAAGAGEVTLISTSGGASAERRESIRALDSAAIVFVSGGDVESGMEVLREADWIEHLRARHHVGIPFIGLSAGTVMLGREWLAWRDPDDDTTAHRFPCLGFVPFVCDAHGEDEAWNELSTLMRLSPAGARGYGISAPAMLRVHPDGRLEAFGGAVLGLERTARGLRETRLL